MKNKLNLIKDKSNKSIKHVFNECKKEEVDGDDEDYGAESPCFPQENKFGMMDK
jgi:hypothetical protein